MSTEIYKLWLHHPEHGSKIFRSDRVERAQSQGWVTERSMLKDKKDKAEEKEVESAEIEIKGMLGEIETPPQPERPKKRHARKKWE